jgi:hypothetical protein
MNDDLNKVFDSVVKNDDTSAKTAFDSYLTQKSVEILKDIRAKRTMNEDGNISPIRLKGNDVYVNGKKEGTLIHDAEENKGIQYVANDGTKHKFKKLKDVYTHLGTAHKLHESKPVEGLDADGDHDGAEDGAEADKKRQKPIKKEIKKVKDK